MGAVQLLSDEAELREAETHLRHRFAEGADFSGDVQLGFQGGQLSGRVYWHAGANIWACVDETSDELPERFWNAFGTSDPRGASGSLTIACEINLARSGFDKRVAGIFGRAVESQHRLLLHRGRIGGGKPGVGERLFWEHFRLERSEVTEGHAQTRVAVVADLDASDAVQRIGEFVHEVKRIKGLASAGGPPASTPIRDLFAAFISGYVEATREPLTNHPIYRTLMDLRKALDQSEAIDAPTVQADCSVGSGKWAQVPWIVFLDDRETTSTMHGVYPAYLFRADMSGVYLVLGQGVTDLRTEHGRPKAQRLMEKRAREIRRKLEALLPGFSFDRAVDLRGSSGRAKDYESSVIAYRYYDAQRLPDDKANVNDLARLAKGYDHYVSAKSFQPGHWWIFQGNPQRYRLADAVRTYTQLTWNVTRYRADVALGDRVVLWQSGPQAGIYAAARVTEGPQEGPQVPADDRFRLDPTLDGSVRCVLEIDQVLADRPILKDEVVAAGLSELAVLRFPQATNYRVKADEWPILQRLLEERAARAPGGAEPMVEPTAANLSQWLLSQGLRYPPSTVALFLTAWQTQGFVILSGISGTGKTKLAQAIARLMSSVAANNHAFLAVRPDWRDSKPIIGYYNPLADHYEGTDVLRLLLEAADPRPIHQPREGVAQLASELTPPYFLILDEMNLARVEYYFADFLSVLESGRDETGFTQEAIRLHDRVGKDEGASTGCRHRITGAEHHPPSSQFVRRRDDQR